MKVWKEASEISMIHELPDKNLRDIDKEMRKKPNFDKSKKGEKGCYKNETSKAEKSSIRTYNKF